MRTRDFLAALFRRPPRAPGPDDPPEGVSRESFARGHETSDISALGVAVFGFTLLIGLGVILLIARVGLGRLTAWDDRYDAERTRREPGAASLVRETAAAAPADAGPLLQVDPAVDLQTMRRDQNATLDTYGWADRPAGVVRLPIERAMDLLAERGLPPVSPGKTILHLQQERALQVNRRGTPPTPPPAARP